MAKYIKPDRSDWTHEQLETELEGALKLYRIAMKQYKDDQSTITKQAETIKVLKEDAEKTFEWCDHADDCNVFRGGMNGDAVCDCGYEELRESHNTSLKSLEGENG